MHNFYSGCIVIKNKDIETVNTYTRRLTITTMLILAVFPFVNLTVIKHLIDGTYCYTFGFMIVESVLDNVQWTSKITTTIKS